MRDEIFDREYQQGRDALNDGIDRAVAKISEFFATTGRAIHAFEFDAPWQDGLARQPNQLLQRVVPAKRAKPVKAVVPTKRATPVKAVKRARAA